MESGKVWPFSQKAREARRREHADRRREKIERWRVERRLKEAREALLVKATNKAEVNLVCHRDTWDFITLRCQAGHRSGHFTAPDDDAIIEKPGGRIGVPVSGRTLAAILDQMNEDAIPAYTPTVNQAMAKHTRDAIEQALNAETEVSSVIIIDLHPDDDVTDGDGDD